MCQAMSGLVYMLCICMFHAMYVCTMQVRVHADLRLFTHVFGSVCKHLPGGGEKVVHASSVFTYIYERYTSMRVYLRGVRKQAGCSPALHDTHTPARTLHSNHLEHGDTRHSDGRRRHERMRPMQKGILPSSWLLKRRAELCVWGERIFRRSRRCCSHRRLEKSWRIRFQW